MSDEVKNLRGLTELDKKILICIANDMSNESMSIYIGIHKYQIGNHRKKLSDNYGLKGPAQITKFCIKQGWIEV